MKRISRSTSRTKHSEEIEFLNHLVIDLKKALNKGLPRAYLATNRITTARLNEAYRMIAQLEACKEVVIFQD